MMTLLNGPVTFPGQLENQGSSSADVSCALHTLPTSVGFSPGQLCLLGLEVQVVNMRMIAERKKERSDTGHDLERKAPA